MISKEEVRELLTSTETYRIERTVSTGDMDKFQEAICAFSKISAIRSNGNILPLPIMSVERFEYEDGELLVAEVSPSLVPPVRYRGRTYA